MEVSGHPDALSTFQPGKQTPRAGNSVGPITRLDVVERATTFIAGISTNRQGWQCTCVNVIFVCVLATIVAVEVLYIFCAALVTQHAMDMRHIAVCDLTRCTRFSEKE
jgi:hypothetical protein